MPGRISDCLEMASASGTLEWPVQMAACSLIWLKWYFPDCLKGMWKSRDFGLLRKPFVLDALPKTWGEGHSFISTVAPYMRMEATSPWHCPSQLWSQCFSPALRHPKEWDHSPVMWCQEGKVKSLYLWLLCEDFTAACMVAFKTFVRNKKPIKI